MKKAIMVALSAILALIPLVSLAESEATSSPDLAPEAVTVIFYQSMDDNPMVKADDGTNYPLDTHRHPMDQLGLPFVSAVIGPNQNGQLPGQVSVKFLDDTFTTTTNQYQLPRVYTYMIELAFDTWAVSAESQTSQGETYRFYQETALRGGLKANSGRLPRVTSGDQVTLTFYDSDEIVAVFEVDLLGILIDHFGDEFPLTATDVATLEWNEFPPLHHLGEKLIFTTPDDQFEIKIRLWDVYYFDPDCPVGGVSLTEDEYIKSAIAGGEER